MTKRYNVTVTDTQAEWLEEIAAHDQVSVSHVIRDALRTQLPRLVELNRFLSDPRSGGVDEALAVMGSIDMLDTLLDEGIAGVGGADVALPVRRKSRQKPPDGNTGAHE